MRSRLLLLASLLLACGSTDDEGDPNAPAMLAPAVPLPECPDHDYGVCDIREPDCQQRLASLAACIRGSEPLGDLRIDLMTEAEYVEKRQQDLADAPEAEISHFGRALELLQLEKPGGVTRAEALETQAKNVLGVYFHEEKRIVVIDHGLPADTAYINATLVHEVVHALQDADYDLSNWPDEPRLTLDSRLARNSVVEGEANFLEYRAIVPLLGLDVAEVDFESAMREHLSFVESKVTESTAPYRDSYATFPYGYGAIRAFHAWQERGARGLDAAWASPPLTTQQILAEQLGLNTPQTSGLEVAEPVVEGLTLVAHDVLGAWGLRLFLAASQLEEPAERALSWRGDSLWVFTESVAEGAVPPDAPSTYVLWQLELESEQAARAVAVANLRSCLGAAVGTRAVFTCNTANSQVPSDLEAWGSSWLRGE